MERLTIDKDVLRDIIIDGNSRDYDVSIPQSIYEELQSYRDAEEQGLLLRLPCKVRDKVWAITTYSWDEHAYEVPLKYPQEKKIQSITVTSDDVLYHVKNRTYSVCNFGKTVFLTREEAEKALAEMQKG